MKYSLMCSLMFALAFAVGACGLTENGRPLERVSSKADADVTHDHGTGPFGNGVFYYKYADK